MLRASGDWKELSKETLGNGIYEPAPGVGEGNDLVAQVFVHPEDGIQIWFDMELSEIHISWPELRHVVIETLTRALKWHEEQEGSSEGKWRT